MSVPKRAPCEIVGGVTRSSTILKVLDLVKLLNLRSFVATPGFPMGTVWVERKTKRMVPVGDFTLVEHECVPNGGIDAR